MKFSCLFRMVSVPLALALLWHCSSRVETPVESLILVTLDTQRADFVGAYGSQKAHTPNIDAFAQNGVLWENAYSLIPITAPAHASLFTSAPPHVLELYNNGQAFRPPKKFKTLAEIFSEKGLETAAFVSLGVVNSSFDLDRGFQVYEDAFPPDRWYLHAEEVNTRVFPWIAKHKDDPFFLWIHYSDPHDPYAPPYLLPDCRVELNGYVWSEVCLQKYELLSWRFPLKKGQNRIVFRSLKPFPGGQKDFRLSLNAIAWEHPEGVTLSFEGIHFVHRGNLKSALIRDEGVITAESPADGVELTITARGNLNLLPSEKILGYAQEVEYMDRQIGFLAEKLREFGLLAKSAIVLVGDHGEGLGEDLTRVGDQYFGHIHYLYQEYMRVPLILVTPSLEKRGLKLHQTVTILDVAPTLLGLFGWKKPGFYRGRDLMRSSGMSEPVFEETYSPEAVYDRFGILDPPWHMVYTPETGRFELYNLKNDPGEDRDLITLEAEEAPLKKIRKKLQRKADKILMHKKDVRILEKERKMLKALGYIR
ncbi:MAG: sulfatase [Candidatus Aminicenantales bacterium]